MKKFTCKSCSYDRFEEVLPDVSLTSSIIDVTKEGDAIQFTYGNTSHEGGDSLNVIYQCVCCGEPVSTEELEELVDNNTTKYKAFLVDIAMCTRVLIPVDMDESSVEGQALLTSLAKERIRAKIDDSFEDNITEVYEDTEVPYDPDYDEE